MHRPVNGRRLGRAPILERCQGIWKPRERCNAARNHSFPVGSILRYARFEPLVETLHLSIVRKERTSGTRTAIATSICSDPGDR